ncbi:MAG: slipin family protein [Candidatus Kapaibacterium sp.]|nr:MAG: slipin family protein [Candidatus Kapabacteria bacterium]
MSFFRKRYTVPPNTTGYFYKNNVLTKKLPPGIYDVWDLDDRTSLLTLPETSKLLTIVNHEVLTKDNIALRFSFTLLYRISDGEQVLRSFPVDYGVYYIEEQLRNIAQFALRQKISTLESETLNDERSNFNNFLTPEMVQEAARFGVELQEALLRDLTFPKNIQDLFAKHLEAKIRAKADIENARTAVATARALKNASELMKGDDNIKFFQMLELLGKIAEKGKHTFVIGDVQQLSKRQD